MGDSRGKGSKTRRVLLSRPDAQLVISCAKENYVTEEEPETAGGTTSSIQIDSAVFEGYLFKPSVSMYGIRIKYTENKEV